MKQLELAPKIIIACDFKNREELSTFLNRFPSNEKLFLKLGMEIIYALGFEIIRELKNLGHYIFLDLKLHDIPVTMVKAFVALSQYQPDFLTVHLSSGSHSLAMLSAIESETKLLGVTVLTSLDDQDLQTMFNQPSLETQTLALNLAKQASLNQLFGIICSPREASVIKENYPSLKLITPGVQLANVINDQKRTATPAEAKLLGSDYLVVGRAITQSPNPVEIYYQILHDFGDK